MYKFSKVVLPVVAVVLVGCSDSVQDAIDDTFPTKASIALSTLENHVVTYENAAGKATHEEQYCPNGMMGADGKSGTWLIDDAGNNLTVHNTKEGFDYTYQTTNGSLEQNKTYDTTTGEAFKVTKIQETICLPVP